MSSEQGGQTTTTVVETKPAPFPAPVGSTETKVTVTQTSRPLVRWGAGLLAGFIRGGAHAVTSGTVIQVMDPAALNDALTRYCILFLFHGVISTMLYLQSHPIPDEWNPATQGERRKETGK